MDNIWRIMTRNTPVKHNRGSERTTPIDSQQGSARKKRTYAQMERSGSSGRSVRTRKLQAGVWGDDETEYGGYPACTGTGGGMNFGSDVDGGGCCVLDYTGLIGRGGRGGGRRGRENVRGIRPVAFEVSAGKRAFRRCRR